MSVINLNLPTGESVCDGKQITFRAPCDCTGVTGLIIDGTTYSIVNPSNKQLSELGEVFTSGSLISVLIDKTNSKAYLQGGGGSQSKKYNVTLSATNWSTTDDVTSYTYTNSDIKSADTIVELLPAVGITSEQYDALQSASIIGSTQSEGSIQLICMGDVPTIDIPVTFIIRGDL